MRAYVDGAMLRALRPAALAASCVAAAAQVAGQKPAASPQPRPSVAQVAELRGHAITLLTRALRSGARAPDLKPAAAAREFEGPDGELLGLQDEVLALLLEQVRKPKS